MIATQNESFFEHKRIVMFSVVMTTIIMFVCHYTNNTVFAYVGMLFMFLPIMVANISECMCLVFFYIPNIRMYAIASSNTLVGFFVIAVFLKVIFILNSKIKLQTILAVAFMGLVILVNAFFVKSSDLFMSFVRFSAGLIIVLTYINLAHTSLDFNFEANKLIKCFIYGCISMVILGVAFNILKGIPLLGTRFSGIRNDPNFYAMILGAALSIQLVEIAFNNKSTVNDFLIALFLLFGGLLSTSRGYLISISINVLILLYIFVMSNTLNSSRKVLIFIILSIILFIFRDSVASVFNSFIERFQSTDFKGANGRTEINEEYMELWKENFETVLFGLGSYSRLLKEGIVFDAHHNYYVQILTSIGIMGVAAMFNIYKLLYKNIIVKIVRFKMFLFFPLITYAVMLMTLPALFDDTHLYMIMLMMMQYKKFQNIRKDIM